MLIFQGREIVELLNLLKFQEVELLQDALVDVGLIQEGEKVLW